MRLISENNSRDVFEAAQHVEDDQEGIEFHLEDEEEEEEESDDESSDDETDDNDDLLLNCPFCQIMFAEKADIIENVSSEHKLEVGNGADVDVGHVDEQEEEDEFCCPFCDETFANKEVALRHVCSLHSDVLLTSESGNVMEREEVFRCPFCELDFSSSNQAVEHVSNGC